jgi:glycosyl hydrolase family 113
VSGATAAVRSALTPFAVSISVGLAALAVAGCGGQAPAAGLLIAQRTPAGAVHARTHAARKAAVLTPAGSPERGPGAADTSAPTAAGGAKRRAPSRPVPANQPALRANWQAGINLTADLAEDFLAPGSDDALRIARADGSTSVEIVTTWYMATATSSSLAADAARTPSDAALTQAAATAQSLGLHVVLKPQVDVLDGTYRGVIAPSDRGAWFASYRAMLVHYAVLARRLKVAGLVVGVELGSMVSGPRDTALWRSMIRSVRRLGFRGSLTYAANWDQLSLVGFWRSLDYVGIDAYFPLIPKGHQYAPTIADLVAAWHGSYVSGSPIDWVAEVTRLERVVRRPVVFTELGYVASACTAAAPYELDPSCASTLRQTTPTETAQLDAYVAALRVWSRVPFVRGIYWWDWPTDANQTTDAYSPRGEPAEQTIARWNAARGELPTQP